MSYGPIMALGLAAMFLYRKAWRKHTIIYALFVCLAAVTALFFGHTSHRSYLDVYWIVFTAGLVSGWFTGEASPCLSSPEMFAQRLPEAKRCVYNE